MTNLIAAEPLIDDDEGDSMVIHMNSKTIDAMKMCDGDHCRVSNVGVASFYGTIAASPDAMEGCVHLNDLSIMCLVASYEDTLQLSSIPLMWAETLEICCVGGDLPPGGVDEVSELLHAYFGASASRMVGLHQIFQVGSEELYFKVDRLSAKPYDESNVGDGTYGTVTLHPGSKHHCMMKIKMAPDSNPPATEAEAGDTDAPNQALPWTLLITKVKMRALRRKETKALGDEAKQKSEADVAIKQFRVWDTNGNGCVSQQEIGVMLDHISPGDFTQADIEGMAARADVNKDGHIDLNEFIAWILK